jgi:hypothetical protein
MIINGLKSNLPKKRGSLNASSEITAVTTIIMMVIIG